MHCFDTFVLIEIARGNPKFEALLGEPFVIPDLILAEFFGVLLRDVGEDVAVLWTERLAGFSVDVSLPTLLRAQHFRREHRKTDMSFFDAVGYQFACDTGNSFVTGDTVFRGMKGVTFIPK